MSTTVVIFMVVQIIVNAMQIAMNVVLTKALERLTLRVGILEAARKERAA